MNVFELLDYAQVPYQRKEQDNVYIECPYCRGDALSINIHSGAWHCWSGKCNKRGHISQLAQEQWNVSDLNFEPSDEPIRIKELTTDELQAIEASLLSVPEIIEFCAKRSLDSDYVLKNKVVGYDRHARAIVIPFRGSNGNIIGGKYRADSGDQWIKGKEPNLYVLDPTVFKGDRIIIVEGEIDAITLAQFGLPVGATLGAGKTKGFESVQRVKQFYLGYDMDSAGDAGVEKAVTTFGHYRCKRVEWLAKDPNDMLKAGATKDQIVECLKNAKPLLKEYKALNGADLLDDFMKEQEKPQPRLSWGYPTLDSYTKGIIPGVIGVLAEAGAGKSTFMYNVAGNNIKMGTKVGIAGYEEHNRDEAIPKITSILIGRNPGGGKFTKEEVELVKPDLKNIHFYEGDETLDDFCDWVKECYYIHGVRLILVDYLQLMVADEKNTEQLKKDCYKVKKLTKEMNGLTIVEIIQPKQQQKLMTKDGMKKNEDLDGADARGGAVINQSVDAMLVIKPVKGHSDLTQFEYTKVRGGLRVSKKAWLGKFTQLEYDHSTLRQTEARSIQYGG